jgi:hypothetical protein
MLTYQFLRSEGILVVTPKGPLTAKDFERLASEVDPFIDTSGHLRGLLIEAHAFPGWESFAGFLSHFRFVRDHHRQIARVAVVSDSGFLSVAPKVADHFVSAEVRHFREGERDAAMSWLREG